MNITGVSYGPPLQTASGGQERVVTTTLAPTPAPARETSTRVEISDAGLSATPPAAGATGLTPTGFGKVGIAAYTAIGN
jgi:hypothetical protein